MLDISHDFVRDCSKKYNERQKTKDRQDEENIRAWIAERPEPKFLDKDHFIKIGEWKTRRPKKYFEANDETLVKEATQLAYNVSNERLKLHILTVLKDVQVAIASTILYFLQPDEFPIFDVRARKSLKKAGRWNRHADDAGVEAWLEYTNIMRCISRKLGVSLRELDKALWAYDKWDGRGQ